MGKHLSILLIDDEEAQLQSLKRFLERRGYEVFTAINGPRGYAIAEAHRIDLVITDYRMPEWDGLTVLRKMKDLNPAIDVVVVTAYGNIEEAVTIMKSGAYDYISKPVDLTELESQINRIEERHLLVSENKHLREQLQEKFKFEAIVSQSSEMEVVLNTAARVAPGKTSVIVRGESGTGKELIARAVHFASPRKDGPFVVVNIAALSENLLESELFGHEKGAFTGAHQRRLGRFEEADGGTLFVDEIGEIPLPLQVKLLRAVQFGEISRLGSNQTVSADVRIIAATHRNLEEMIKEGLFREDLYYRLNVVSIRIPPLRERKADIPLLVSHFIQKHAARSDKPVPGISSEAMDFLAKYDFPGNVRELENIIEHAVVFSRGDQILRRDLPEHLPGAAENDLFDPHRLEHGYSKKISAFEKTLLAEALQRSGGNQSAAARLLGMTERHLRSRMQKLNMSAKH